MYTLKEEPRRQSIKNERCISRLLLVQHLGSVDRRGLYRQSALEEGNKRADAIAAARHAHGLGVAREVVQRADRPGAHPAVPGAQQRQQPWDGRAVASRLPPPALRSF